jgi:hypothetical protein
MSSLYVDDDDEENDEDLVDPQNMENDSQVPEEDYGAQEQMSQSYEQSESMDNNVHEDHDDQDDQMNSDEKYHQGE